VKKEDRQQEQQPGRKRKPKRSYLQYYVILGAILVLLTIILSILNQFSPTGVVDPRVLPITEYEAEPVTPPETIKPENIVPERVLPPEERQRLYIVIDDVGYDLSALKRFLDFPGDMTFAVLPGLPHTREAAEMIHRAGKTVILHQPMEPLGKENPGDRAILTTMSDIEIENILERNFAEVPYAVGMNNHMGSKATADERVMRVVLDFCRRKGILFLDSRTISNADITEKILKEIGTSYISRNSMFLDNEQNKESIVKAFAVGLGIAKKTGKAVMIGHVTTSELAESLLEMYPSLIEEGYTFKEVSDFIFGNEEPHEGSWY